MSVALFPSNSLGRNEPCHCGSGKKYKQCCLSKDEAAERSARAKAAEKAEKAEKSEKAAEKAESAEAAPAKQPPRPPKHQTDQPWKSGGPKNMPSFQKIRTPRKVGGS
jgi:SEC-C motif-containing protein